VLYGNWLRIKRNKGGLNKGAGDQVAKTWASVLRKTARGRRAQQKSKSSPALSADNAFENGRRGTGGREDGEEHRG